MTSMIVLIGTGHVFDLSAALIEVFDSYQPETICVELDRQRYHQLLMKQRGDSSNRNVSTNVSFLYRMLARFQQNLAEKYGVTPGEEMLTALQYAQSHQVPMQLIDMNAQQVFSQMLKEMTLKEKIRLLFSGIGGLFVSQKRVESELDKMQGDLTSYLDRIGESFPTIKKSLIDDRNQFMVDRLLSLTEDYEIIAAVVGDGHISGMTMLLKDRNIDVETIRLAQLQQQMRDNQDGSQASFHVSYHHPW